MNPHYARELGEPRLRDDFPGEVPVKLTKDELRKLSALSQWRSVLQIAAEWSLIIGAIWVCQLFWNPILYAATVMFIGARQHALLILMHDGAHRRLFRNRRVNDWAAELLLAWPHFVSAHAYRHNHVAHHRYLNTAQDPDWARKQGDPAWVFPKPRRVLVWLLLRDLSGLGVLDLLRTVRNLSAKDARVTKGYALARGGFYVAVAVALAWAGAVKLFILYWVIPFSTWLILILHVRSIAEHFAMRGGSGAYAQTRTTLPSLFERVLVAPKRVNFHVEHHFFPSVPFYRLPELHALLMSKPGCRDSVHLTRTYLGVLRECTARAEGRPDSEPGQKRAAPMDALVSSARHNDDRRIEASW